MSLPIEDADAERVFAWRDRQREQEVRVFAWVAWIALTVSLVSLFLSIARLVIQP